MSQNVPLKLRSAAFEYLATEVAHELIIPVVKIFVIGQMIFQLDVRSESLLALVLGALDDSWLSGLVELQVLLKVCVTVKALATKFAIVQPNGVHLSPMHI
jgi:cell shape-determining protein MreD